MNNILCTLIKSVWKHRSKRLGRGFSSGKGKTAGRGMKGQKARERDMPTYFEGGQTRVAQRLPKHGGQAAIRDTYAVSAKIFESKKLTKDSTMEEIVKRLKIPFYYKKFKVIGLKDKINYSTSTIIRPNNTKD